MFRKVVAICVIIVELGRGTKIVCCDGPAESEKVQRQKQRFGTFNLDFLPAKDVRMPFSLREDCWNKPGREETSFDSPCPGLGQNVRYYFLYPLASPFSNARA